MVNSEHSGGLADGEGEIDIHENVTAALGDDDVGKKRGEWQEGTGDGKQTQVVSALSPLLTQQSDDELMANERQTEQ